VSINVSENLCNFYKTKLLLPPAIGLTVKQSFPDIPQMFNIILAYHIWNVYLIQKLIIMRNYCRQSSSCRLVYVLVVKELIHRYFKWCAAKRLCNCYCQRRIYLCDSSFSDRHYEEKFYKRGDASTRKGCIYKSSYYLNRLGELRWTKVYDKLFVTNCFAHVLKL